MVREGQASTATPAEAGEQPYAQQFILSETPKVKRVTSVASGLFTQTGAPSSSPANKPAVVALGPEPLNLCNGGPPSVIRFCPNWSTATSPSRWAEPEKNLAAVGSGGSQLKETVEESFLLHSSIALAPSGEEALENEGSEYEAETVFTVVGATSETISASTADRSTSSSNCSNGSSTSCFSPKYIVKNEEPQELPLPTQDQAVPSRGCQNSTSAVCDQPVSNRSQKESSGSNKLQVHPSRRRNILGCASGCLEIPTSASNAGFPLPTHQHQMLPPALAGGTMGVVAPPPPRVRSWGRFPPRCPMFYACSNFAGTSSGCASCLMHSASLGPNGQGGCGSKSPATAPLVFPAAMGQSLSACTFGSPHIFPSPLSTGAGSAGLSPKTQQQKQRSQTSNSQKQLCLALATAKAHSNISVILTALRRHLRSLIRIMYNKIPLGPTAQRNLKEPSRFLQSFSSQVGCGADGFGVPSNALSPHRRSNFSEGCASGLTSSLDDEVRQPSQGQILEAGTPRGTADQQESLNPFNTDKQRQSGPDSSRSSASPSPPQTRHAGGFEGLAQPATLFPSTRSRAEVTADAVAPLTVTPSSLQTANGGAAESWEGQCSFHERHLDVCSLSELSEYLQVFASFLGLAFSEVSHQDPLTLQHVRLQLLLLRNSQQQKPQQRQQAKPLFQLWLPLLRGPAVSARGESEEDGGILYCSGPGEVAAMGSCRRPMTTPPSLVALPFTNLNSPIVPSFASSSGGHLNGDESATASTAITGQHTTACHATAGENGINARNQSYFSYRPFVIDACQRFRNCLSAAAGEWEGPTEGPLTLGNSEFPSSSVDAFSVDCPASTNTFPRSSNTCSGETLPATSECFMSSVATASIPAGANNSTPFGTALTVVKTRPLWSWGSECDAASAAGASTAIRWSLVRDASSGLKLQGLMAGSGTSRLESTVSVPESAGTVVAKQDTEASAETSACGNGCEKAIALPGGTSAELLSPLAPFKLAKEAKHFTAISQLAGPPLASCTFANSDHASGSTACFPFVRTGGITRGSPVRGPTCPADLGLVVSAEGIGQGKNQRGNVQVTFSPQMGAWVVCCASGLLQQSRAFSVAALGFERAKKVALQYATQCEPAGDAAKAWLSTSST